MGDTKSAMGPARSREMVFANESIWTCPEVARSFDGTNVVLAPEDDSDGGRESTIVPMFDKTISH